MQIAKIATSMTMTSKEMADLTEKRHDNVKRTIETLAEKGVISQPQIEDGGKSANGVMEKLYRIGKRDSYIIVAQLSPEFTARLVDRWQELEGKHAQPRDLSRMDILKLAMESEEGRLKAEAQLAIAAPKAQFVDRYVESTGLKSFRDVAKLLAIKEPALRSFLTDNKIMYRLGGEWMPFAPHLDAGRFEVRTGTSDSGHAYTTARFTAKGVAWLAGLIGSKSATDALEAAS